MATERNRPSRIANYPTRGANSVVNTLDRRTISPVCLCCSGMLAKDTICAEMVFMLMDRNRPSRIAGYPMRGTNSIVNAWTGNLKQ